jgi:DNA-binding beta-propeller fold protein YncE
MVAADPAGGFLVFAGGGPEDVPWTITPMSADGVLGTSVPVQDAGLPQGLEVVHGQWWLYSSLVQGNRITKIDPADGHVVDTIELAMPGEGEGEALDPATGAVYVGCHGPNRFGVLERVVVR